MATAPDWQVRMAHEVEGAPHKGVGACSRCWQPFGRGEAVAVAALNH